MEAGEFDVLIIGGGLIGLCSAAALGALGYRVLVAEKRAEGAAGNDRRVLALSEGSRLILNRLGIWSRMADVTTITEIIVSDQGNPTTVALRATECDVPALGYVTPFDHLMLALMQHLRTLNHVTLRYDCEARLLDTNDRSARASLTGSSDEQVSASLVVHAEGGSDSFARDDTHKDYGQWAIVTEIQTDLAQRGSAREHFTEHGPVALLPLREHHSVIWTVPESERVTFLSMHSAEFTHRLESCLGLQPDTVREMGVRAGFPLKLRKARRTVETRAIRLGNAAQQLHPVAAQGFNLGLRDVWALHECLWESPIDPGAAVHLDRYARERRQDREVSVWITDSMVEVFGSRNPLLRASRGAALTAFAKFKSLRAILAQRMMFGSR